MKELDELSANGTIECEWLNVDYVPGKTNVVAEMLSRPFSQKEESCEICPITVDLPTKSVKEIREEQLKDENVKK